MTNPRLAFHWPPDFVIVTQRFPTQALPRGGRAVETAPGGSPGIRPAVPPVTPPGFTQLSLAMLSVAK
eukprot:1319928-Pyramimonas_sp.AAC.1